MISDDWWCRIRNRPERPERLILCRCSHDTSAWCRRRGVVGDNFATTARSWVGPMGTLSNPVGQCGDLFGFEFFLGGHLNFPLIADRRNQRALTGLARHNYWPGITPLEHRGANIEPQSSLLLLGPVTFETVVSDYRTNSCFEELFLSRFKLPLIRLVAITRTDDR